jgi:hypothetical protein
MTFMLSQQKRAGTYRWVISFPGSKDAKRGAMSDEILMPVN